MVFAELIEPSLLNWKVWGDQIFKIEQSIYGKKFLDKETMKSEINNPRVCLVLLKEGDLVVGFTYALPESKKIAHIIDTALAKEYQNKGFVSILMSCLENQLRKRGYEYITRRAMVENGYADKITKNYSGKIVETSEFVGKWGKQRNFKIRL